MQRLHSAFTSLSLAASFAVAGCAADAGTPVTDDSSILGGLPAKSTKFDAVGLLYGVRPTGAAPICTGTLIGPHTVLAAAHCVRPKNAPFNIIDKFPVYFAVGYDSAAPTMNVRAVWGGITTFEGHDVGLYQLEEEPAGITPIAVADAPLGDDDIGRKLSIVGYGLQDGDDHFADFLTRRVARFSITSFDAQPLHELFPTFEEFKSFMEDNAGKEFTTEQATLIYDHQIVREGDVFLGSPDEPQISYLDSGAPALDLVDGVLTVRGVNSRSYRADPTVMPTGMAEDLLPVGTVIAMTGAIEDTQTMIADTLAAPCRSVTAAGHCSATTAIRCADELPTPTVSLVECADFGAICVVDEDGLAGCGDPPQQ